LRETTPIWVQAKAADHPAAFAFAFARVAKGMKFTMRKKRFHGFHILASVVAACIATVLLMLSVVQLRVGGGALTLLSAYELIQDKFVGPYDETQVVDRALSSMVNALGDQWSYYLTAEEYEEQNLRRTNHYVGIGVTVEYTREEGLLITEVTEAARQTRRASWRGRS